MFKKLLILLIFVNFTRPLYPDNPVIEQITEKNFDKIILGNDDVWLIQFYTPWCSHCQNLIPEFKRTATALKGIVKVGVVNVDNEKLLAKKYKVENFPTILIFSGNKINPQEYNKSRTAEGMTNAALTAIKNNIQSSLQASGGIISYRKSNSTRPRNDVIKLTDLTFDETVLKSNDMWLVEFYAPWCEHCKKLELSWEQVAHELKNRIKVGAIDATVEQVTASRFNIKGFPTIKIFPLGTKQDTSAMDYTGPRNAKEIVFWALDKLSEKIPPPDIKQIVNSYMFKTDCSNKPLCVIAFLPHILDCQSKCRKDYLHILREQGDMFKRKLWGWVWSEGGAQMDLENHLEIGSFGYPVLAVINKNLMTYSILREPFTAESIYLFLRDLSYGKGDAASMPRTTPKIFNIQPWDEKDAKVKELEGSSETFEYKGEL